MVPFAAVLVSRPMAQLALQAAGQALPELKLSPEPVAPLIVLSLRREPEFAPRHYPQSL
ncbi:hypothetical protein D3C72_2532690 [compost metagenome]